MHQSACQENSDILLDFSRPNIYINLPVQQIYIMNDLPRCISNILMISENL